MQKIITLELARLALGFIFFWSFLDKLFGFGFATQSGKAWINGVSPTLGYLKFAAKGPAASIFHSMAGNILVDSLFMAGLGLIGLALLLGIGRKVAGCSGAVLLFFIWLSAFPPVQNPAIDEHVIYILLLLSFTQLPVGQWLGFGKRWSQLKFVQRHPFLQ